MNETLISFAEFYRKEYLFTIKTDEIIKDNIKGCTATYFKCKKRCENIGKSKYSGNNFSNYHKDPVVLDQFIAGSDLSPADLIKKVDKIYTRAKYGNTFIKHNDFNLRFKYT